jgi:hypothetical protein
MKQIEECMIQIHILISLKSTDAAYVYIASCWWFPDSDSQIATLCTLKLKILLSQLELAPLFGSLYHPHPPGGGDPFRLRTYTVESEYSNTPIEWIRCEVVSRTFGYRVMTFLLFLLMLLIEEQRRLLCPFLRLRLIRSSDPDATADSLEPQLT